MVSKLSLLSLREAMARLPSRIDRIRVRRLLRAWPLRLALASLPVLWLLRRVQFDAIGHHIAELGMKPLLASVLAGFFAFLVGALRWRTLLRAYGAPNAVSVPTLFRHNLVAAYFNLLPSGLAGEAIRGARVRGAGIDLTASYTVLLVERLCGLLGLMLVTAAPVALDPQLRGGAFGRALDLGVVLTIVLVFAVLLLPYALRRFPSWRRAVARFPVVGPRLATVPAPQSLPGLAAACALSVITQSFGVLSIAILVHSLAPATSLLACGRVLPMAMLLTYVPLTPGAIGQREAVYVYMLGFIGVSASAAVATSLLVFSIGLSYAGLGAFFFLAERSR